MDAATKTAPAAAAPAGEGKKGRKRGKRGGAKGAATPAAADAAPAAAAPAAAAKSPQPAAKGQQSPKAPQQPKGKKQAKPDAAVKTEAVAAAPAKAPQQQKQKGGQPQKQQQAGKANGQKPAAAAATNGKQQGGKKGKKGGNGAPAAAAKPAVAAEPEQKKAKVDKKEEEELMSAGALEAALKEADEAQDGLEKLSEEEAAAVQVIQRQFNSKRKSHFAKRKVALDKIPEFWLQAFNNTPATNLISESDIPILKFWKDFNCIETTDEAADKDKHADDFKLVFTFDKNPYFQNKQVWKEFKYTADGDVKTTASPIQWNKGKCPFGAKDKSEKQQPEKAKGKRTLEEAGDDDEGEPSFFEWFKSDETEADLGEYLRDALWSNPIKYFLGEGSDDEDDDFMDEFSDEGDSDDVDGEEDAGEEDE